MQRIVRKGLNCGLNVLIWYAKLLYLVYSINVCQNHPVLLLYSRNQNVTPPVVYHCGRACLV